ncbi:MAG: DUF169 domain-containing protein [Candidatus Hodarchaeota archaeon]
MSKKFSIYTEIGLKLEQYLRPSSFPIAIKLIKEEKEIPDGCKRLKKDLKFKNFLCQNFKMVRSYGWTLAITEEDCVCKLARGVYGWDTITEDSLNLLNQFSVGLYTKDVETAERWYKNLYLLNNEFLGLVISPLTKTKIKPDIVQIYCNPAQAMRLIQSYLYLKGGIFQFTAAGRAGSCHDGVIKTFLTDEPQLVILGNGDRVWGGAEDSEVMFSIPNSKLESIIEGLEATHKGGLRYPIPKYMNYTPGFQTEFMNKALERAGSTIVKKE